jgi:hypothetical protein
MPILRRSYTRKRPGRGKKLLPTPAEKKTSLRKVTTTSDEAVVVLSRLPVVPRHIRRLRKIGWAILSVVEGGKSPAVVGGYKAASKEWKKLEAFFAANPRLNYGIATGAVSAFFALDIDGREGRATLAEHVKKHGPLPKTITVIIPHGQHRLFKSPGYPIPNSVRRLGPGIDVRRRTPRDGPRAHHQEQDGARLSPWRRPGKATGNDGGLGKLVQTRRESR